MQLLKKPNKDFWMSFASVTPILLSLLLIVHFTAQTAGIRFAPPIPPPDATIYDVLPFYVVVAVLAYAAGILTHILILSFRERSSLEKNTTIRKTPADTRNR